ncbi:hypothetical protein POM88_002762 [Heracleum sosnowskyi]|uniref:PPC domain-containing protein n=1 Tax=Heracleum sosnowskyi TaxID=360622 RepID=A0AAD8NBL2_9APIA|nr:hypothetical protein POM88_002762 [Heracleum sosnowskyi]
MSNFENPTSPTNLLNSPSGPSQISINNIIEYSPIENSVIVNFGMPSSKRPRGRPIGSKNKPKREVNNNISPSPTTNQIIIQVPPKVNIIQWVVSFAQQHGVSLAILRGSGSISEVNLKQTGSQIPSRVFMEEMNLISFSGVYLFSSSVGVSSTTNFFNALLGQRNGSVVAGSVLGMLSFGPVMLSAITFSDPDFYKIKI